jgi:AcrR family transcriptional regulator
LDVTVRARKSRAESAEETREDLLAAGVRVLMKAAPTHAFGHVKADAVAAEAGRTVGAFFHHWPTQGEYHHDLVSFVLSPARSATFPLLQERLSAELAGGASANAAIMSTCRYAFELIPRDPQTIVELLIWSRAVLDQEFRQSIAELYLTLDDSFVHMFDNLLAVIGRKIRPPFTMELVNIVIVAIGQSLAIRRLITPSTIPDDLLGLTVLQLIPLFTSALDDDLPASAFVGINAN